MRSEELQLSMRSSYAQATWVLLFQSMGSGSHSEMQSNAKITYLFNKRHGYTMEGAINVDVEPIDLPYRLLVPEL